MRALLISSALLAPLVAACGDGSLGMRDASVDAAPSPSDAGAAGPRRVFSAPIVR
ncbi:MAG: hypothetical protein KF901_18165 [Myxococcales bacterium]|nr:hypothetical protein [Myxococcales bacterium]